MGGSSLPTLKQQWPDVPVIWGGYFPTVHPDVVVRDPHIDVVVIGQGEQTLAEGPSRPPRWGFGL